MDDAFLMRRFECFRNLFRDGQCLIDRNRPSLDALGQRLSRHEFHHQELPSAGFFDAVDRRDVGMIQRRQHAGFALESRRSVRIVS